MSTSELSKIATQEGICEEVLIRWLKQNAHRQVHIIVSLAVRAVLRVYPLALSGIKSEKLRLCLWRCLWIMSRYAIGSVTRKDFGSEPMYFSLHAIQHEIYDLLEDAGDPCTHVVALSMANTSLAVFFLNDVNNSGAGLLTLASSMSETTNPFIGKPYIQIAALALVRDIELLESGEYILNLPLWHSSIPKEFASIIVEATVRFSKSQYSFFSEYQDFMKGDYQNSKSWNIYELEWGELVGKKSKGIPRVLISYSWDSEPDKEWVLNLANNLRSRSIDVRLDQLHLRPGLSFTQFMEVEASICDLVIVICTPTYRKKSIDRSGGVGFEQQIISAQIFSGKLKGKCIPILRKGEYEGEACAIPPNLSGIVAVDMKDDEGFSRNLCLLEQTILQSHDNVK